MSADLHKELRLKFGDTEEIQLIKGSFSKFGLNPKTSTVSDIKQKYREFALKLHPDRNKNDPTAHSRFIVYQEMYQLLIKYSEREEKDEIILDNEIPDRRSIFNFHAPSSSTTFFSGPFRTNGFTEKREKNIKVTLDVTLEECYHGCQKQVSFMRKTTGDDSCHGPSMETKDFTVTIRPGTKNRSTIKIERQGHLQPEGVIKTRTDVVIIINQLPHRIYRSEEHNLIHERTFTLQQSLSGIKFELDDIDKTQPKIKIDLSLIPQAITKEYIHVVIGKGMLKSKNPEVRGDLIVKIKITLPQDISEFHKNILDCLSTT